jgi:integrase
MPRHPKLRKKKIGNSAYWFTKAGGETYFGNINEVPFQEARKLFSDHVKSLVENEKSSKRQTLKAGELMDLFLEWVKKNRSGRTYSTRKTYCSRFGSFRVGSQGTPIADLPAHRVKSTDLEAWLDHLKDGMQLDAQTRVHAETSVRHCWNWATKYPSPTPYLPPSFRPFAGVERTRVPLKALTEEDLITDQEIKTLLEAAKVDLDEFHRFGPKKRRAVNPYAGFADMLKCYYHTGARTGELAGCRVEDVLFRTHQVVLGKHKRSSTLRNPTPRHITLNDEALEIFRRQCEGKKHDDHVFLNSDNRPWARQTLPDRFERIKEIAEKKKLGKVRRHITIYDFRHLWISEALMSGNDVATVAKMAGTSIAMIERVYGHFRNEHLREAQARLDEARKKRNA